MVEINNQRAVPRYAGRGRRELITDVRKPEIMVMIVGGELFNDYPDHPRKLVTLNPNSNQQAPDATSFFPVGGDAYRKQLGLEDSSESQDAVALQQIKERGALPMIDRGDIRQAIDRCSNIWASLPGAVILPEHKADSLIAKFKEAGGTVREIDV